MEKATSSSSTTTFRNCVSLAELARVLILDLLLVPVSNLQKFSLRFLTKNNTSGKDTRGLLQLRGEEVETVMERLGMLSSCQERERLKECVVGGFGELTAMFEEVGPSLEEAKEAFHVFDENCDGFIDAAELQRILRKLGFGEGAELEACKEMLARHDLNQDGRIDFNEFVRFMENSFC